MADLEDKKVSQLESGTVTSNSVFLDSGNGVSTKVGSQDVANFVGKTHAFSGSGGLNTTAKTLVGAINEVAGSAGKSNLADMDDVNIDDQTLAGGQGLVYDDTNDEWVNGDVASTLASLTDVDIDSTSLADGQAIVYDETNDKWVNGTVSGGASVIQLTMAQYTALPSADKMNGSIYKITDKALIYCLDEAYHAVLEITSTDYALLTSDEKNNGTLYIITDEETTASDIPYASGVSVADKLDDINANIALETLTSKITAVQGVSLEIISLHKQGNIAIISFVLRIPNISGTILTFTDVFPSATTFNTVKDNDNVVPYLKIERTSTGGKLVTDVTKTTNGLVIGEIIFIVD